MLPSLIVLTLLVQQPAFRKIKQRLVLLRQLRRDFAALWAQVQWFLLRQHS